MAELFLYPVEFPIELIRSIPSLLAGGVTA